MATPTTLEPTIPETDNRPRKVSYDGVAPGASAPGTPTAVAENAKAGNSTDATRGEPLASRALKRRAELEQALAALPDDAARARTDLTLALSSVDAMLTGDHEHLSEATASDLSRWLEGAKHLAESPSGAGPRVAANPSKH